MQNFKYISSPRAKNWIIAAQDKLLESKIHSQMPKLDSHRPKLDSLRPNNDSQSPKLYS